MAATGENGGSGTHTTAAELVSAARGKRGMSQRQLAQAAGVAQSTVSTIESGHRQPSVSMLERLLDAAGFRLETRLVNAIRPSQLLEQHRDDVAKVFAGYPVSQVWVFGSVARGDDRPDSDLDLLIELTPGASIIDIIDLDEEISAVLGCPVDVVTTTELESHDLLRRVRALHGPSRRCRDTSPALGGTSSTRIRSAPTLFRRACGAGTTPRPSRCWWWRPSAGSDSRPPNGTRTRRRRQFDQFVRHRGQRWRRREIRRCWCAWGGLGTQRLVLDVSRGPGHRVWPCTSRQAVAERRAALSLTSHDRPSPRGAANRVARHRLARHINAPSQWNNSPAR